MNNYETKFKNRQSIFVTYLKEIVNWIESPHRNSLGCYRNLNSWTQGEWTWVTENLCILATVLDKTEKGGFYDYDNISPRDASASTIIGHKEARWKGSDVELLH